MEEAPGDKKDGTKAETEAPQPKKIPKEADFLIYTCAKEIGNLKKITFFLIHRQINSQFKVIDYDISFFFSSSMNKINTLTIHTKWM